MSVGSAVALLRVITQHLECSIITWDCRRKFRCFYELHASLALLCSVDSLGRYFFIRTESCLGHLLTSNY